MESLTKRFEHDRFGFHLMLPQNLGLSVVIYQTLRLFIYTALPCTAGLDIAIVLDKSKSVKLPNLEKAITFIGDLVKTFHPAPDGDHFGFITFHEKAQMVFKFADSQYHEKNALLQKIAKEPRKLELYTRTDLALIMARDQLFTEEGGDRPDKPNVMIVLTDGRPTKPKGDKSFNFKEFADKIAEDFKVSLLLSLFFFFCIFFSQDVQLALNLIYVRKDFSLIWVKKLVIKREDTLLAMQISITVSNFDSHPGN